MNLKVCQHEHKEQKECPRLTFFDYTAWFNKYGDFDLDEFLAQRQLKSTLLLQFLNWFASAIVGKEVWHGTCKTTDLSTIMSVGDEAFLYLTIEGNYDKWRYMLTTVR